MSSLTVSVSTSPIGSPPNQSSSRHSPISSTTITTVVPQPSLSDIMTTTSSQFMSSVLPIKTHARSESGGSGGGSMGSSLLPLTIASSVSASGLPVGSMSGLSNAVSTSSGSDMLFG